jgi:hypothetical protein
MPARTPRLSRWLRPVATLTALALACLVPLVGAPAAGANTPSSWSGNYKGIEYGWTNNHAWAIASYSAAIAQGSGEVAALLCSAAAEEPVVGSACRSAVASIASSLMSGHPRLTNHGLWIAYYVWGSGPTSGTY